MNGKPQNIQLNQAAVFYLQDKNKEDCVWCRYSINGNQVSPERFLCEWMRHKTFKIQGEAKTLCEMAAFLYTHTEGRWRKYL